MREVFDCMKEIRKQERKEYFYENLEKLNKFLSLNPNFSAVIHEDIRHVHLFFKGKKITTVFFSRQKFDTVYKHHLKKLINVK